MADNEMVAVARQELRELLNQCTKGQVEMFNRQYVSIDKISFSDMEWASKQLKQYIELNKYKERMK